MDGIRIETSSCLAAEVSLKRFIMLYFWMTLFKIPLEKYFLPLESTYILAKIPLEIPGKNILLYEPC